MNAKTTIPELDQMVAELKEYLNNKAESLEITNSHTTSKLENRKNDIDFFEAQTRKVQVSSFEKKTVINNFKQDADKIKNAIDEIS